MIQIVIAVYFIKKVIRTRFLVVLDSLFFFKLVVKIQVAFGIEVVTLHSVHCDSSGQS